MRVTNKMTSELITRELYSNQQMLLNAQVRVTTGKKINKPSDDPIGAQKVLDYRRILSSIEQYERNIVHGKNQIEITETILDQMDTLLNEAHKWASAYGSGSIEAGSAEEKAAITHVKALYDDILSLANSKIGNDYIFAGHVTNTAPFSRSADYTPNAYNGDDEDITVLVRDNVEVKINATGQDIFERGTGSGTDVFNVLKDLIDSMETTQDPAAAFAEAANLKSAIAQVQGVAIDISIHHGRLKSAEDYLRQYESKIEDLLDNTENIDPAQAIIEMQMAETAYMASLETASRVIQRSLVDYLK
jgi:flagellar hook-associated protein 3 FlgL